MDENEYEQLDSIIDDIPEDTNCEDYIEEEGDQVVEDYDEELEYEDEHQDDEQINIHDDELLNFDENHEYDDEVCDREESVDEKNESISDKNEEDMGQKEEEEEIEETITPEEKHAAFLILDGYMRQMEEEKYTLRKLRSIIGKQTDDIDDLRNRIARYTRDAQDNKADEAMEKLKRLKGEREKAVEERKISTDLLTGIRCKREDKIRELKDRGVRVDSDRAYLIEDKELRNLFLDIKRTLLKYNSFAVLKYPVEDLDTILDHVASVSDDINEYLTIKDVRPRDINKLNTKERRIVVLYDKLLKWREYKVENPDIRPTDYESFLYDPDDMFSESDDEAYDQREKARIRKRSREMRSVRGGSPADSERKSKISDRSPIRPPSPAPAPSYNSAPKIHAPLERRAVCGGEDDDDEEEDNEEEEVVPVRRKKTLIREPIFSKVEDSAPRIRRNDKVMQRGYSPVRRGSSLGRRKRPDSDVTGISKRRAIVERNDYDRPRFSPTRHSPPSRRQTNDRQKPLRRSPNNRRNRIGGREKERMPEHRNTDYLNRNNRGKFRESRGYTSRKPARSPSPPPSFARSRENFQISIKNEGYPRRSGGHNPRREKYPNKPMRHSGHKRAFRR